MADPMSRTLIITPAKPGSRVGNRATADRWARLLGRLGRRVEVATTYDGRDAEVMIALHAWRSAGAIGAFRAAHPQRGLIVGLAGTDVYEYLHSDPATTLASLHAADFLVGLHGLVGEALPPDVRPKLRVIYQSADAPPCAGEPSREHFDVCVIAHLRDVKDPLRTAWAARRLPADSTLRVTHLGGVREPVWASRAVEEMAENPRFVWRDEVSQDEVWQTLCRSRLLVISSVAEGGANVISEAMAAGVPVLASRIDGNVDLLGEDYPGYFGVGDTDALRDLLHKAETDPAFLVQLRRACTARAPLFTSAHELEAWRRLLDELAVRQRREE